MSAKRAIKSHKSPPGQFIKQQVFRADSTILTQMMADEFSFLWSQIQNCIAEVDADGGCRCGILLSPCFGALFVADLTVGIEESELHHRCRGRFDVRKTRMATIAVRITIAIPIHRSLHTSEPRNPQKVSERSSRASHQESAGKDPER